jgi:hypothetical protein
LKAAISGTVKQTQVEVVVHKVTGWFACESIGNPKRGQDETDARILEWWNKERREPWSIELEKQRKREETGMRAGKHRLISCRSRWNGA